MASSTIPLAIDSDLLTELREAARITKLSQADVMRQSMRLGLPGLIESLRTDPVLKPMTAAEAREAFAPDKEWDDLEATASRCNRQTPDED